MNKSLRSEKTMGDGGFMELEGEAALRGAVTFNQRIQLGPGDSKEWNLGNPYTDFSFFSPSSLLPELPVG